MKLVALPFELIDIILRRPELARETRLVCTVFANYHGDWEELMDEFYAQILQSPLSLIQTNDNGFKTLLSLPSREELSWNIKSSRVIPFTFEHAIDARILDEFARCNPEFPVYDELTELICSVVNIPQINPRPKILEYIYPPAINFTTYHWNWIPKIKKFHRYFAEKYMREHYITFVNSPDDIVFPEKYNSICEIFWYIDGLSDLDSDDFIMMVRSLPGIDKVMIADARFERDLSYHQNIYNELRISSMNYSINRAEILGCIDEVCAACDDIACWRFIRD